MVPVYIVIFLAGLSFSAVVPFLVFLVMQNGGNGFVLGAIGAAFWVAQFIGASWLGPLSDRIGRKRVLLRSQLGALFAWLLFLLATVAPSTRMFSVDTRLTGAFVVTIPIVLIAASRIFEGLLDSSVSITNAYVSDLMRDARKAGFARLSIATNLGYILGPLVAGVIAMQGDGITLVALLTVAASALAAFVCLSLRDVPPCIETPDAVMRRGEAASGVLFGAPCREAVQRPAKALIRETLASSELRPLFAIYFAVFLGFSIFTSALPMHAARDLRWTGPELGLFFSVLAGALVVTEWLVLPALETQLGDAALGLLGTVVTIASYLAMTVSSPVILFAAGVFYGIGNGIAWPSYLSLLARTAPEELQGSVQGVGSSVSSLASFIGTLLSGVLFETIGERTFYVAAGSLGIAATLFASVWVANPASRLRRKAPLSSR
jgi:MFS family permease